MSTLPNGKKHYLTGEDLFENFDVAYNTINAMLAGTEPNFAQMISILNEFKEEQWISSLINKPKSLISFTLPTIISPNL